MNINQLYDYLENQALLNQATLNELKDLISRYPYFQAAHLLYLKNLFILNDDKYQSELENSSVYFFDRQALHDFIHSDIKADEKINIQIETDKTKEADTIELNEKYLKTFESEKKLTFQEWLNFVSANKEFISTNNKVEHNDLIDRFLNNLDNLEKIKPSANADTTDLTENLVQPEELEIVSENLAQLYDSQGYFDKALKIYEKLILKYPEKSIYFANKIEEIKKKINKKN